MNILFVCNGNVARSQEAEAFFNTSKKTHDEAKSGGINVKLGKPIDPKVVTVMDELGFDVSTAQRKVADEAAATKADLIISFKPAAELPEYISKHKNIEYWDIPDPQHQPIEFHRRVRDEVRSRVGTLINKLSSLSGSNFVN